MVLFNDLGFLFKNGTKREIWFVMSDALIKYLRVMFKAEKAEILTADISKTKQMRGGLKAAVFVLQKH